MLRFVEALLYRDEVLKQLRSLLLMYPRGRLLERDYPGLRGAVRAHFEAGLTPAAAALQLAAGIIRHLLRDLGKAERADIAARLERASWDELRSLAARRISRKRPERGSNTDFAAQLIGVAIFMARGLSDDGRMARSEFGFFVAGIDDVLGSGSGAGELPGGLAGRFGYTDQAEGRR